MNPARYGITLASPGTLLATMGEYKNIPQLEGSMAYFYAFEHNKANAWLVKETDKRYHTVPDTGTALAFNAGIAIVQAIQTAGGTDTEKLIKALEGMRFDSAKGPITIRADDHQALQEMYQVRFKTDQSVAWAVPELVRMLTPEMIDLPVGVKHSN
jgi:branched-chain amino acid transport system substrate-binding protein